jgi:hypothetical protein
VQTFVILCAGKSFYAAYFTGPTDREMALDRLILTTSQRSGLGDYGLDTTRDACAASAFPRVFPDESRLVPDFLFVGREGFLHACLQSEDSRNKSCLMETGGPSPGRGSREKFKSRFLM